MKRRDFLTATAAAAGALTAGEFTLAQTQKKAEVPRRTILNFNENMEYRRLGKTNLMVSAVCMGGHWKRIGNVVPGVQGTGFSKTDLANASTPNSPLREEDNERARMAIRYILGNPAVTAPLTGLITPQQVDNAAKAVMERRKLDEKEKARLECISTEMWANLRPSHQWLRNWEYA